MVQDDFVANLYYLCTDIELVEDFLIFTPVKDQKQFCKINSMRIKLLLEEFNRNIPIEEKIHNFVINRLSFFNRRLSWFVYLEETKMIFDLFIYS